MFPMTFNLRNSVVKSDDSHVNVATVALYMSPKCRCGKQHNMHTLTWNRPSLVWYSSKLPTNFSNVLIFYVESKIVSVTFYLGDNSLTKSDDSM